MISRMREYLPAVLNLFAATIIMIISFSDYFKFSISSINAKLIGIIIVYIGMGIFVWASFYLKRAIAGMIQPRLNNLVTNGPYKYCRHPVYFGITISFIGLAFALRACVKIVVRNLFRTWKLLKYCQFITSEINLALQFEYSHNLLKSWLGLLAVLLIFLPSEIHRAKLEEKLLLDKFGEEWLAYKNNTSFFIPIKKS